MNKAELVSAMAEKTELSKKDAEAALKAFTDVVAEELKKGEKIQLVGFGTFEVSERAARTGIPSGYQSLAGRISFWWKFSSAGGTQAERLANIGVDEHRADVTKANLNTQISEPTMTTAKPETATVPPVVSFEEQLKHARELVVEGQRLLYVANRDLRAGRNVVRRTQQLLADTESVFSAKLVDSVLAALLKRTVRLCAPSDHQTKSPRRRTLASACTPNPNE